LIRAMWPWLPTKVGTEWSNGTLFYTYQPDSGPLIRKPDYEILHVRGLETDGFWGLSPITVHRQTLAQAQAMQKHACSFYKNNARPSGVLTFPAGISVQKVKDSREAWEKVHGGSGNAYKLGILHEGVTYTGVNIMSMADAQFVETANLSLGDIARIFNLPAHKIGDLSRSTNNNIEHQSMEYLEDCLDPHFCNWESELALSLLSDLNERPYHIINFDRNAVRRMDSRGRAAYIAAMRQWSGFTPNDVCRFEGLNPYPDENANKLYAPVNMIPLDMASKIAEKQAEPAPVPQSTPSSTPEGE